MLMKNIKKLTFLIKDIQENYELSDSEIKDVSLFNDNFEWNINNKKEEENSMNKYAKIVNIVVAKIEQLPSGSEKSVAELMSDNIKSYDMTDLFENKIGV